MEHWTRGVVGDTGCALLQEARSSALPEPPCLPWAICGFWGEKLWQQTLYLLLFRPQGSSDTAPTLFSLLPQASNGQWYQMNDNLVRSSNIQVVLNQQAYLLFYLR